MTIEIKPVPAYPATATQLRVDDGHVQLGIGANFQWALLDVDGNIVAGPGRNDLTQNQYDTWIDDESVAEDVAENLGLIPA